MILTVQVSPLTRRSYNFNVSQFSKLVSLFRGTVIEEQIDKTIEITQAIDHQTTKQSEQQTIVQNLETIDELQSIVNELKHTLLEMNVKIDQIFKMLESQTSNTLVTVQPQIPVFEDHISDDMPMFIPM